MNILADEQQKIFEPGISEDEKQKREQIFFDLYYKTLHKDENSFLGRLSLNKRKNFINLFFSYSVLRIFLVVLNARL